MKNTYFEVRFRVFIKFGDFDLCVCFELFELFLWPYPGHTKGCDPNLSGMSGPRRSLIDDDANMPITQDKPKNLGLSMAVSIPPCGKTRVVKHQHVRKFGAKREI